ncbi:hypothetical protein AAFF_G00084950 [Aldrovandia affinis]|uniref:Uncharacterized protein n=1 Tax=Aldrovandia affinis TaxID=143900 RepID=A0AAD7RX31_9TELE|nr:hypothetical protein AAFF_G00084950 [Aldrovandia affinis]
MSVGGTPQFHTRGPEQTGRGAGGFCSPCTGPWGTSGPSHAWRIQSGCRRESTEVTFQRPMALQLPPVNQSVEKQLVGQRKCTEESGESDALTIVYMALPPVWQHPCDDSQETSDAPVRSVLTHCGGHDDTRNTTEHPDPVFPQRNINIILLNHTSSSQRWCGY